jgi:hypothetical protein
MERKYVLRGFAVGALAGLLAFVVARIFAEPLIQQAIDYETGRDAAQAVLDRAAGIAAEAAGSEPFSRGVQRNEGIGIGIVLFGAALGGFFSVAYALAARKFPTVRPRVLALWIAGLGFLGFYLTPFVKYPANPPAIGHEDTIGTRGSLYLVMVLASIAMVLVVVSLGRRLVPRMGSWNAIIAAGATFVVVMGVVMAIMPDFGHLASNVRAFGRHDTETPLALRDAAGTIVFPGFPADLLFQFRLVSLLDQLVLWGGIGLGFGALAERLAAARSAAPAAVRAATAARA